MDDTPRHGRRSSATDPKLDRKLQGLTGRERSTLLDDLVGRYTPDERGYGEEQSKRAGVLAVLYAYPRASYSALATLLYGDDSLENRLKVAGHANQLGEEKRLQKVGRGAWEPGPSHPARAVRGK